jgi:hypothetical protein
MIVLLFVLLRFLEFEKRRRIKTDAIKKDHQTMVLVETLVLVISQVILFRTAFEE